jgi:muramoyltetrapeptide carboxypeptidase
MKTISPKKLKKGDKVAVICSSAPMIATEVTEGCDLLNEMGLIPVLGPNVKNLRTKNANAATVPERLDEIMWAFTDPKISACMEALGGVGSALLLPHMDFQKIRASRKIYLGMSDISALNNGLLSNAGLINFSAQGPSIRLDKGQKIRKSDSISLKHTIELLMSEDEWGSRPFDISDRFPQTICGGQARGQAQGGNIDTYTRLLGTEFFPDPKGAILFLEDVHKSGELVQRMLTHMEIAGVFEEISGICFGEFVDVPEKQEEKDPAIEDILQDFFRDRLPCLYNFNFSHGPLTVPIPIGSQVYMDADNGIVNFKFSMD